MSEPDRELRRALEQVDGPWWLIREAVASTRMDRGDVGTYSLDEPPPDPAPEA